MHSPYVFQLADACLTAKVDKNFRKRFEAVLRELRADKKEFDIQDFGAGSQKAAKRKSVAAMIRQSSSIGIYGDLLYRLAHYFKPQSILELGTNVGIGTIQLAQRTDSLVYTVEGCSNTQRAAMRTFDLMGSSNIISFCDTFGHFLDVPGLPQFDMVFIDGNHRSEALFEYLDKLKTITSDETVFILDDIRWNDDMWQAWQQLQRDERFHVTIDLGRMGLLVRRPQQTKEHFILRPLIFKTPFF